MTYDHQTALTRAVFLAVVALFFFTKSLFAQFVPPENITLTMYRLEENSGDKVVPFALCRPNDQSYGCTANTEQLQYEYPYLTSTITISIDGIDGPDNDEYAYAYLWDLVTVELGMHTTDGSFPTIDHYVPHSAIEAQAIAARTYAYHRTTYVGTIDNSNTYHVYLPNSYRALLSAEQQEDVRLGTQRHLYLAESNTSFPIDAQYGADNDEDTTEGSPTLVSGINYLSSVQDPISALEGVDFGTDRGGMSSRGARRWAYGYQRYIPNTNSTVDRWNVRWDDSFQILTHYYTGIHLRDANNPSATVSAIPDARWVPLNVHWYTENGNSPEDLCVGGAIPLEIWVQNTGTSTWASGGSIVMGYEELPGQQVQAATNGTAYPLQPIAPGETYTATLIYQAPSGVADGHIVAPRFEMLQGTTPFSQLEVGKSWPDYSAQITMRDCEQVYLPLVHNSTVTAANQ